MIPKPSPCLRSWTLASVRIESGTLPPLLRISESAIEKQLACAAAISSSGLVPGSSSKRVPNEYAPSMTPEALLNVPLPPARSPFHSAVAVLIAIGPPRSRVERANRLRPCSLSSS